MKSKDLTDFIDIEASIECHNCHKVSIEWGADEYTASDAFFEKGWRKGREHVYCPDCAPKKLKNINIK